MLRRSFMGHHSWARYSGLASYLEARTPELPLRSPFSILNLHFYLKKWGIWVEWMKVLSYQKSSCISPSLLTPTGKDPTSSAWNTVSFLWAAESNPTSIIRGETAEPRGSEYRGFSAQSFHLTVWQNTSPPRGSICSICRWGSYLKVLLKRIKWM